ncbi:amino acid adenylation domain-containing protein [Kribbella sp. NPDC056345]|uniref:non-ribosomal peptide synthetase n=1 Tax=Kribbella sp. NPDC056345 TaxID=3345789 RepID=UPI0035DF28B0
MTAPRVENIYRLTFLQEGLLFHSVEDPDAAFYVDQVTYRLTGDVDPEALRQAWQLTTERHSVLRTSFHWQGVSELVQVVHREVEVELEALDWRDRPAARHEEELEAFLQADRLSGFSLESAPLIRMMLIRLAEREYRFVFCYHHMLIDAWSGLMVLNEAFGYYDQLADGKTPEVVAARPFHDYVSWVRGQSIADAEQFWRAALAGVQDPTPIPIIGVPGGASDDVRDNPEESARLSAEIVGALQQAARKHQVTVGALLQTAWALLLSRYSDRTEVVFGGTIASRPAELPGVEETAGLFISTLPVRVRLEAGDSVLAVCRRLQTDQAAMRSFDFSPLAQIQQWSEVAAGDPLFDSIMTVLNVPGIGALGERDGAVRLRAGDYRYRTNYPLSLLAIPGTAGDFTLRVGYAPDRVRQADVRRLLGHLTTIVTAIADDPSRPAAAVPMLTDAELAAFEVSPVAAADRPAHELITAVAARAGDAPAIRHQTGTMSYGELDRNSNRLAAYLRSAGVSVGDVVAISLPRSADQIVAMLAVLKAGGAFLPLDPAHPAERLTAISVEAEVKVLITSKDRRSRLPRTGGRTVLMDAHAARIAQADDALFAVEVSSDDIAYLIYTSGSTGRPKGVMVTHGGLSNLVLAQAERFGLSGDDVVLQWAAATFDASVFDVMLALGSGACLVVADDDRVAPGRELSDLLRAENVSALTITPSALAATPVVDLPSLRLLIVAGEALPTALVAQWAPGRRMVNAYGPTEATVWVTSADVSSSSGRPSIGVPIRNAWVRVLDSAGRPVPIGVPGELYVGGAGVARGYAGRPEQTDERFRADPAGRIYRTGDLVRWLADGELEFVGRVDRQLKIRGFRIEPGEVENVLRQIAGVRDCAVVAQRSAAVELPDTLAAYVVVDGVTPAEILDGLGAELPPYLVPTVVARVERIPLTVHGKLDEAALPAAAAAAKANEAGSVETPADARTLSVAEEAVTALWAEILGVDAVGPDDDFFLLGGNSIKATQVVSRVRRAWQLELPIRAVFETRTVAKFAALLEEELAE